MVRLLAQRRASVCCFVSGDVDRNGFPVVLPLDSSFATTGVQMIVTVAFAISPALAVTTHVTGGQVAREAGIRAEGDLPGDRDW